MSRTEAYSTHFENESKNAFLEILIGNKILITLETESNCINSFATIEELGELKESIEKAISAYNELHPESNELH